VGKRLLFFSVDSTLEKVLKLAFHPEKALFNKDWLLPNPF
jgi:hypothetical protein